MRGYLRQLASDFGESTNSIRVELNKLSEAKIITSQMEGRNKVYQANVSHPLFNEIRNIVLKSTGITQVVSNILDKLGDVRTAFIRGDYALGNDSGLIDLVAVGNNINLQELERVKTKTENLINRKISVLVLKEDEFEKLRNNFEKETVLVLLEDQKD